MNKFRYIFALALLLCGPGAAGQEFRGEGLRYEIVHKNNLWNSSRNITGVRQDSVSRSFAELYGSYEYGDFRDTWQAEKGWRAGAATASIRHLENISFAGSFSFGQTEGYGMCGSMFIKPGTYPVDVLEFTPGRKTLQTYSFNGGVSYDLASSWRIGAKIDFESANIAKRKDLRHSNKRLEMSAAPGFMYHHGDFAIGASYIFEKTSETVEAKQIGTAESSYWAFLDKGMMYGVYSVWTGSGIHLDDSGIKNFPVNDLSNGFAVQTQYKGLFAEIEYMNTKGSVGEKEYIWFNFPGHRAGALVGYVHDGRKARHNARVRFGWDGLSLRENILERITENGVNTVLHHGYNRILARETVSLSPEYEMISSRFELTAGADFRWTNSLSSQMYPYLYKQSLFTYSVRVGLLLHAGRFDLIGLLGQAGGKVDETGGTAAEESGVQGEPFRLQDWYQRNMDFRTGRKTTVNLALRYNFRNGMYLEGARNILYKGVNPNTDIYRTEWTLKFGYNF